MLNTDDFIKRLEKLMTFNGLNASGLADKLAIQRSSISHILSGRNKPSLDLILKIISEFPDVDFYWLLLGKGSYPSNSTEKTRPIYTQTKLQVEDNPVVSGNEISKSTPLPSYSRSSDVEKIVFFYTDGSFKEYENTPK